MELFLLKIGDGGKRFLVRVNNGVSATGSNETGKNY